MTEEEYWNGLQSNAGGSGTDLPQESAQKVEVTQVYLLLFTELLIEGQDPTNIYPYVLVYSQEDSNNLSKFRSNAVSACANRNLDYMWLIPEEEVSLPAISPEKSCCSDACDTVADLKWMC